MKHCHTGTVSLITETDAKCLTGVIRQTEMIHFLGGMELDGTRFRHATQNNTRFNTRELFMSGMLHLIFSDLGLPRRWVTEIAESETLNRRGLLHTHNLHFCHGL